MLDNVLSVFNIAKIEKMIIDEKYMRRCLQLARKGLGYARPNPLVGAVIVDNDEIIGEGYHREYGKPHAEVNAVNSVKDRSRLATSTMYVSLEPCAHYGKTPPCAELIVKSGIRRVVVAATDPNPSVAGKGLDILRNAGVEVVSGVMEKEAVEQNRIFRVNQILKRPYVILKWAQSSDGFIDRCRALGSGENATVFSNVLSSAFVHKLRTEVQSIMVGTNTALLDNPSLTARNWYGQNPVRVVIDKEFKIPAGSALLGGEAETVVISDSDCASNYEGVKYLKVDLDTNSISNILKALYDEGYYSVLIEGGSVLLSSFIDQNIWDEAFVEISPLILNDGVRAPNLNIQNGCIRFFGENIQHHLKNKITQNIN